jgi:DNA-binding NarL/FixJ family response regulator
MTAPPIPTTGDEVADDELALLRSTTQAIHSAQQQVMDLSLERMRLVLSLRRRGVLFRQIADAVPTTENTVYKIHREARRAEDRGELT